MAAGNFDKLQDLRWRGIVYPVADRTVSFMQENVDHRIQYRSNDYPEPIGPHSWLFRYQIPMRDGLNHKKYGALFNEVLPILIRDMRNKEPGDLIDPVMGLYRCIPTSYSETTDVNKRDGTDVTVDFLYAPRIGDDEPELPQTITGIVGAIAEGFDDENLALVDWKQEPSPEGTTSLLNQINGFGRQGLRQVDRLASQVDALSFQMQKVEETADAASNPQNWRIRDSARQLHLDLIKAKERLTEDPYTKVKRVVVNHNITLLSLAKDSGMTLKELISLNPQLARTQVVFSGTNIKIIVRNTTTKT